MSVDHDLLADFVGGALEGTPEQERVAELIATSTEWGRAADELTAALHGVQNDLNVLKETPERMPADVAARFEGLFDGPRRDPLEPRVVTRHSARAGKRAGQTTARRWKRWAAPVAIAAAALGLFAIGKLPSIVAPTMNEATAGRSNAQLSADAPGAMPPAQVPTTVTGRMYDRGNLQQHRLANGALAPYGSATADMTAETQKASGGDATPWQRLLDPAALQQCLSTVAAVLPGGVDAVEYAYFEGSPALVISITSKDARWQFVAGMNCGQLGPDERYRTPPK